LIPNFEESGVLPPFIGDGPTKPANQAPYKVTLEAFVEHFATSEERVGILIGFLQYRTNLKGAGVTDGFQWLDGSFVENVEKTRGRAPNDIDLVTFAHRPNGYSSNDWKGFVQANLSLFSPKMAKASYKCDAYFVDLNLPPKAVVSHTKYWFGLFSHQRETSLWKGMIELELSYDEGPVLQKLLNGGSYAS
ncbi:DUF6932 family protein, partial [Vreelandella zhanjiangensis]|uniref:DUF6932 family protein n=1 Tax=Vreelandella zhanjiangensis TaxID=1121960 RepID=UPI00402AEF28